MTNACPFCADENAAAASVCRWCGRDIAPPPSLIAERERLIRARDQIRADVARARAELEALRGRNRPRSA